MRTILTGFLLIIFSTLGAQRPCATSEYIHKLTTEDAALAKRLQQAEFFISQQQARTSGGDSEPNALPIITIPVVVHVLYNQPSQNISDEQVFSQIEALNRDFRRQNEDTSLTPERFRHLAADVMIQFVLATADPEGRPTNGIVRKATSQAFFRDDDKIKFNQTGGSNAWNSPHYLNIWVGPLQSIIGYATVPGAPADRDGIVIATSAFGTINTVAPYHLGRTAVHEAGHWLGLKHIWGDHYCGDDLVDDTPKQGNFTPGCPNTFRSSCNNGVTGDMYMNYMDYTSDACTNLFTKGQKQRMRALFASGGARHSLTGSRGLDAPWNFTPADEVPDVMPVAAFPNPAQTEIFIQLDQAWQGKVLRVVDMNGQILLTQLVSASRQRIDLKALRPGIYFILAEGKEGIIRQKFIKL